MSYYLMQHFLNCKFPSTKCLGRIWSLIYPIIVLIQCFTVMKIRSKIIFCPKLSNIKVEEHLDNKEAIILRKMNRKKVHNININKLLNKININKLF